MDRVTSCERMGIDLQGGTLTSHQLALAAQRGDAAAFQQLVHDYDAMVMRVALTLTASEDTAQEIYCKVLRDGCVRRRVASRMTCRLLLCPKTVDRILQGPGDEFWRGIKDFRQRANLQTVELL